MLNIGAQPDIYTGVKPLIVPLESFEDVTDAYWQCYPAELEAEVLKCFSEGNGLGHPDGKCLRRIQNE